MEFFSPKKVSILSRTLLNIISSLIVTENKQRKKLLFSPKQGLTPLEKCLFLDLKNIYFFIAKSVPFSSKTLSKTLFCNQDHHQTPFLVVFLVGRNNEKFKFSYKNYMFTPLEIWDFSDIKNCLAYSLKSYFLSRAPPSTISSSYF